MTRRALLWMLGIVSAVLIGGWPVLSEPLSPLPALARDLPEDFRAADAVFKEQVAREFHLPIGEPRLIAELDRQGFDVSPGWAVFEQRSFPYVLRWRISWETRQGEAVSMTPVYGALCP